MFTYRVPNPLPPLPEWGAVMEQFKNAGLVFDYVIEDDAGMTLYFRGGPALDHPDGT